MKNKILSGLLAMLAVFFVTACSEDDSYSVAKDALVSGVTTGSSDVTANTATLHATVEGDLSRVASSTYQVAFRFGTSAEAMSATATVLNGTEFSLTVDGLTENKTYYYQAQLTLQGKVTYVGEVKTLVTTDAKVTTADAQLLSGDTFGATLGGSVTNMPATGDLMTGIVIAAESDVETVRSGLILASAEAAASFSVTKAGLLPGKTYYYAGFLNLGAGVVYGDVKSFTTASHAVDVNEDFVDLGLSTKWCKFNLGAKAETALGGLFGFGDLTGVNNSIEVDDYADADIYKTGRDVAHATYQQTTLPTAQDFEELFQRCSYEWTTKGEVSGLEFTGPNGNKLFLPAAGERNGNDVSAEGVIGAYLTGSYNANNAALSYRFSQNGGDRASSAVYTALSIRPISSAKNVAFQKALLCNTWHIDLRADGSHAHFAGPMYFYGTDDSWASVTNGEPVLGDSWSWEADYAGNSWIVGEDPRDFGSMTFTEDGKVSVTTIAADGNATTVEGTYTVDEAAKTITLDGVDLLGLPSQIGKTRNARTNLKVLSLTDETLQIAVLRDPELSGEGPCLLSFNYVPDILFSGIEVQFTICDTNWTSGWPDAIARVAMTDIGQQQTVTFKGSRANGMIVLLDAIEMAAKFPQLMIRVDDILVDGQHINFDASKFYYGDIENKGNYRVEMFNIYGAGTANDNPFYSDDHDKVDALACSEKIEVLFTIVPKPESVIGLTTCDSNWNSAWPDTTIGFDPFENFKPVSNKEYTISYDSSRANGMIYLVEAKGLKAAFPAARMTLRSISIDGAAVSYDPTKILSGDLENNGNYRIEIYNTYGGTRGNSPFADETADGIVPSLGFNSNITVTFTLDNLF